MDSGEFAEIVDQQLRLCSDVLVDKAREYATEDRLHNFRVAAAIRDVPMKEVLGGMMVKHTVSIYDMIGSAESYSLEQWSEKITDHMNYLILLWAIVHEPPDRDTSNPELVQARDLGQAIADYLQFPKKDENA